MSEPSVAIIIDVPVHARYLEVRISVLGACYKVSVGLANDEWGQGGAEMHLGLNLNNSGAY